MEFGIIGLGRMGTNLARQALEKGHRVVGYDPSPEAGEALEKDGAVAASAVGELAAQLRPPRIILIYVPHSGPTDAVVDELARLLPGLGGGAKAQDIVADGGNSHWRDSVRHFEQLAAAGISFLDVGTSGGLEGARRGACFMVGGEPGPYARIKPLLSDLAVAGGVIHAGAPGAGHFVKLIHNAIEFGMVQALAEGVDLLARSDYPLDMPALFDTWSHGSVIRGWLVELLSRGLRGEELSNLSAEVEDTREVKWAVEFALEKEAWVPVIAQSELAFYRYRDPDSVAGKAVSLLRHGFGGHPVKRP